MGRKNQRPFILMAVLCSAAGVVLGGTASWAESSRCLQDMAPSNECLTKAPAIRVIEGMSVGLLSGLGAAVGATWQAKRDRS